MGKVSLITKRLGYNYGITEYMSSKRFRLRNVDLNKNDDIDVHLITKRI